MTDEMIAAMAKKGGVMQINFGCEFLSQKSADAARGGNAPGSRAPRSPTWWRTSTTW